MEYRSAKRDMVEQANVQQMVSQTHVIIVCSDTSLSLKLFLSFSVTFIVSLFIMTTAADTDGFYLN